MNDLANPMDPKTGTDRHCPRCGQELPQGLTVAECPKCLLQAGLDTALPTQSGTVEAGSPAARPPGSGGLPLPGDVFGHYLIVRLLGQGGMGTVYEAEDVDSGRQVALKVLNQALDSPDARRRFFREGRLAASINHPNSVYVFGTEEIGGVPVIAMELVPGGTLQERVNRDGPWPANQAVDAVLEMIAGLAAAQSIGILHRDIKPSNGYIDADGHVKIGDYGLSISTGLKNEATLTAAGCFMGTPAFSSPEQLRGDELTVRSDIYALGVTLYYLLTARHPFAGASMVQLIAAVLERSPESPARLRPELPQGLCDVVLRCLARNPQDRFANYAELRAALEPFASSAPRPAPLRLRFLAGLLDSFLLVLPQEALVFLILSDWLVGGGGRAGWPPLLVLSKLVIALTYYGVLEGVSGASMGKSVCGLAVIRGDRDLPGFARAILRAFIFSGVSLAPTLIQWLISGERNLPTRGEWWQALFGVGSVALTAALFVTMRRANGWAALHDLLTRTRVVLREERPVRVAPVTQAETPPTALTLPEVGPFQILQELESEPKASLLMGFDPRLLRRVWIRRASEGARPIPARLRQIGRPGRLRWLSGRRAASEGWDAYAALSGQPLTKAIASPVPWGTVRLWLLDLAEELESATGDQTVPEELGLDRIWITAEGRAVLLDFPGPGAASGPAVRSPLELVRKTASCALAGLLPAEAGVGPDVPPVPLPLHARGFLEALASGPPLTTVVEELRSMAVRPSQVDRRRRLILLGGCGAFPIIALAVGLIGWFAAAQSQRHYSELAPLRECLSHLDRRGGAEVPKRALETYIAGRFAPMVHNPALWGSLTVRMTLPARQRQMAEQLAARTPPPSAEEFERATEEVESFFGGTPEQAAARGMSVPKWQMLALILGYGNTILFVVGPALLGSLFFRGGLLVHLMGIAFVRHDGRLAGRGRVLFRTFLAWLPFLVLPGIPLLCRPWLSASAATALGMLMVVSLAAWSVLPARRSPQDWLAGSFPVPK